MTEPGQATGPGAPATPPPPAPNGAPPVPPSGSVPSWQPSAPASPMSREPRAGGLVAGIILVVVGAVFLVLQVGNITLGPDAWPLWLIVPGLAMLGGSLFIPSRGSLGLAVPGAIIATVGAILWVQATYGLYGTWVYAWALVAPTAPGVAMLLVGAVHRDPDLVGDGARALLTGIGLFIGFALFFEGVIGISGHRIANLDRILPYASIGLGILFVVLSVLGGGGDPAERAQRRAQRRAERERRRAERAAGR